MPFISLQKVILWGLLVAPGSEGRGDLAGLETYGGKRLEAKWRMRGQFVVTLMIWYYIVQFNIT